MSNSVGIHSLATGVAVFLLTPGLSACGTVRPSAAPHVVKVQLTPLSGDFLQYTDRELSTYNFPTGAPFDEIDSLEAPIWRIAPGELMRRDGARDLQRPEAARQSEE